jgi:glutaredoxin
VTVAIEDFSDPHLTVIYGVDTCEDTTRARERFDAAGRIFRYVNLDLEPETRARLHAQGYTNTPVVVSPSGEVAVEPSDEVLDDLIALSA